MSNMHRRDLLLPTPPTRLFQPPPPAVRLKPPPPPPAFRLNPLPPPVTTATPANPEKDPEICLSNLWKHCKLEGHCPDMHYYLPYRWQINKGTNWEDIPNMEEIEKCYCDPTIDRVQSIDFLTMRSGVHRVRRLSTVSSVMKPPEYVLTTEWLWYWKDNYDIWTLYGHSNDVINVNSSVYSSDLENIYLNDPTTVIPFIVFIHCYEMNFRERGATANNSSRKMSTRGQDSPRPRYRPPTRFTYREGGDPLMSDLPNFIFTFRRVFEEPEMKQKNVRSKRKRDALRRPKYQSFEDVNLLRGRTKSSAPQAPVKTAPPPPEDSNAPLKTAPPPPKTDIYPSTWDTSALPEIGCQKVPVSDTSSEFSEIVSSFTKTVSGHVVKKLWRLQNPSLWQVFQWQKEQMKKINQGQEVKEMRLFHGTDTAHIVAICNQNFDWRLCGTHGTAYGQGSYFARDASYAHKYSSKAPDGTQSMFVARVLVGDFTIGNQQMKRPPQRPGSTTEYYDSCVDNITDPSIFVVFEKHQIFPEYLLEY